MHPATGPFLQNHHIKQKTNGIRRPGKRREAAVTSSVAHFPFSEYSFILTPASHFIMIYSGENAGGGGGVAWREWGGAPEGLFSQLMTRNTLLFFAGQTFAVHKHVESSD